MSREAAVTALVAASKQTASKIRSAGRQSFPRSRLGLGPWQWCLGDRHCCVQCRECMHGRYGIDRNGVITRRIDLQAEPLEGSLTDR